MFGTHRFEFVGNCDVVGAFEVKHHVHLVEGAGYGKPDIEVHDAGVCAVLCNVCPDLVVSQHMECRVEHVAAEFHIAALLEVKRFLTYHRH